MGKNAILTFTFKAQDIPPLCIKCSYNTWLGDKYGCCLGHCIKLVQENNQ